MTARLERAPRTQATVAPSSQPSDAPVAVDNRDLLTEPAPVAASDLTALFALMSAQRDAGAEVEQGQIKDDAAERDASMRERMEALRREAEVGRGRGFFGSFEKVLGDAVRNTVRFKPTRLVTDTAQNLDDMVNSKQFWSDLAKGASAVTKVAAVVIAGATLITGPGAVGGIAMAAGVVSVLSMVEGQANILGRLGVDGKVAGRIRLGVALGTLAMGGVGAITHATSSASSLAGTAAQRAGDFAKVANGARVAASVVEPTGAAVERGALVGVQARENVAENFRADGEQAGHAKDAAQRDLEHHLRLATERMENHEEILGIIQQTMAERSRTTLSLTSAIGGRA